MRKTKEEEIDITYTGEEIKPDETKCKETPLCQIAYETIKKSEERRKDIPVPNCKQEYLWITADVLRDFYK